MVFTKKSGDSKIESPSTEKKRRRSSLDPSELPTVAEQRQRAKEWAEKQNASIKETTVVEKVEKKPTAKRGTKTKTVDVDEAVEPSVEPKISRRSNKKEPVSKVLSEEESPVEDVPVPKKTRTTTRTKDVKPVEIESTVNTTSKSSAPSPEVVSRDTNTKTTTPRQITPRKKDEEDFFFTARKEPRSEIFSRKLIDKTPIKETTPRATQNVSYLAPETAQEDDVTEDVQHDDEPKSSTCRAAAICTSSVCEYVCILLVLSTWAFALYVDQTVGAVSLVGFFALLFLKRVVSRLLGTNQSQGIP